MRCATTLQTRRVIGGGSRDRAVSLSDRPRCASQVTGHWPDYSNQEDLAKLGAEAFAFVNVARFAIPLRIGLALSTTPWVRDNVVGNIPFLNKDKKE